MSFWNKPAAVLASACVGIVLFYAVAALLLVRLAPAGSPVPAFSYVLLAALASFSTLSPVLAYVGIGFLTGGWRKPDGEKPDGGEPAEGEEAGGLT